MRLNFIFMLKVLSQDGALCETTGKSEYSERGIPLQITDCYLTIKLYIALVQGYLFVTPIQSHEILTFQLLERRR